MKKESVLMAILSCFVVYLDIILKIVYSNVGEIHAVGDYWWLLILIVIAILYIICSIKDSLLIHIITYLSSFIPIIVSIFYLINLDLPNVDADWKLVVIYIVSELILLVPAYVLQLKKVIKIYKCEI